MDDPVRNYFIQLMQQAANQNRNLQIPDGNAMDSINRQWDQLAKRSRLDIIPGGKSGNND